MHKIIHKEIDIPFDSYTHFVAYLKTRNYQLFNLQLLSSSKTLYQFSLFLAIITIYWFTLSIINFIVIIIIFICLSSPFEVVQ